MDGVCAPLLLVMFQTNQRDDIYWGIGFVPLLVNIIEGNVLLNVIFNTLQIDNTKKNNGNIAWVLLFAI